ncbi:transcriptional regulator HexR [Exilibacterium tricleocarpae]|uniref:Transcriptional regulator HexR n=1 Tax=Exilibacterium tricleocarpae TaxID=2591008 RepID=A0A545U6Y5_9GAMM|nr:transcriptional regulator HexR [Exilibacterium tricleocarpae]TQV85251.1 transcriptional regulator HexR [Exilibacterium tricleocarpae]
MGILQTLQTQLQTLSNAERRIAEIVLAEPASVIHTSTASLARRAQVSDPTVARFCRSLGCSGFPAFKVLLAQHLARGAPYLSRAVSAGDSTDGYINKLIDATQAGLEAVRTQIDRSAVEQAVAALTRARRLEIYGMGAGAAIAQDAQHKFFRLGKPVIAYEDNLKQRMAAATAEGDTAIVLLSFTGRTTALLEVAEIARQSSAVCLAITAPDSPLAARCQHAITVDTSWEDTTLYTPMTSRMAFLAVVDILATGVALQLGDRIAPRLRRVKESLLATKTDK